MGLCVDDALAAVVDDDDCFDLSLRYCCDDYYYHNDCYCGSVSRDFVAQYCSIVAKQDEKVSSNDSEREPWKKCLVSYQQLVSSQRL